MKTYQRCLHGWYCCIAILQITEDVMDLKGVFQVFGIIQALHITEEETIITATNRDRNSHTNVFYQSCKEQVETSGAMEGHLRDGGICGLHLLSTPNMIPELISIPFWYHCQLKPKSSWLKESLFVSEVYDVIDSFCVYLGHHLEWEREREKEIEREAQRQERGEEGGGRGEEGAGVGEGEWEVKPEINDNNSNVSVLFNSSGRY